MVPVRKQIEQIVSTIYALDLESIKFRLMEKHEGLGWTREQADRHELEYKRFLILLAKYPDELIAPSTTVDKFWHCHILDTRKYAQDCEQVFGYFLHHCPYLGRRGLEDVTNHVAAAQNMKRLYEQEFGSWEQVEVSWCGAEPQWGFSTTKANVHLLNAYAGSSLRSI